jgi:(p)ppGpp synthase/HD superfamily hydrolase
MYKIAAITTLYLLVIQLVFQDRLTSRMHVKVPGKIDVIMDSSEKSLCKVLSVFEEHGMEIDTTAIKKHKGDSLLYTFNVNMPETVSNIDVVNAISQFKNVQSVDM